MTLVAEKKNKNEQTLPLPPDQQSSGGMKKDIIKVFFMVLSLIPGKLLPSFVRFFSFGFVAGRVSKKAAGD